MFGNASDIGTKQQFPFMTLDRFGTSKHDFATPAWFSNMGYFWRWEDFLWDAFDIDEHWLATYDASASGTPTLGLSADATGGAFQIQLASTSEAETAGLSMGNNLYIRGNLPFLWMARIQVVHTMAANEVLVFGLASDVDSATLDNLTRNIWFRLDADTDLLFEYDDGTTDTDDKDLGIDITEDVYYWYAIERQRNGQIYLHVADDDGENHKVFNPAKQFSVVNPTFGANNLQPVILAQKASGTTQPELLVDCMGFFGARA